MECNLAHSPPEAMSALSKEVRTMKTALLLASPAALLVSLCLAPEAAAAPALKVTICHVSQDEGDRKEITVSANSVELDKHLKHGDSIGPCEEVPICEFGGYIDPVISLECPSLTQSAGDYLCSEGVSCSSSYQPTFVDCRFLTRIDEVFVHVEIKCECCSD